MRVIGRAFDNVIGGDFQRKPQAAAVLKVVADQLVVFPPSDGLAWEQLLGRLHRLGQKADEVRTWVYRHTAEMRDALDSAARYAKYMQGITRNQQKLLSADLPWAIGREQKNTVASV